MPKMNLFQVATLANGSGLDSVFLHGLWRTCQVECACTCMFEASAAAFGLTHVLRSRHAESFKEWIFESAQSKDLRTLLMATRLRQSALNRILSENRRSRNEERGELTQKQGAQGRAAGRGFILTKRYVVYGCTSSCSQVLRVNCILTCNLVLGQGWGCAH